MNIPVMITNFQKLGYRFTIEGDELICETTTYRFTDNQHAVLKKYKSRIIRFLRGEKRDSQKAQTI